jgi:hypothetical protein
MRYMSQIKDYLSRCGELISNNSYSIPKDKIKEFIGLLRDVEIAEESHFGPLDYFLANRHTYYHGKSSFHMEGSRLYIADYYTGCDLSDPEFEKLRVNTDGNYYQLLFDYLINGYYSEKCLIFTIGKRGGSNSRAAQEIQQFRAKWNAGDEKESLRHLTAAKILSSANENYCGLTTQELTKKTGCVFAQDIDVYVTSERFTDKVCRFVNKDTVVPVDGKLRINTGKCMVSLKPHPFSYEEVENLRRVIVSVNMPSIILTGVYYETVLKEILIQYADLVGNFSEEIIAEVYSRVLKSILPDIEASIRAFKEADTLLEYTEGLDIYDVFAGCWASDFEHTAEPDQQTSSIEEADETDIAEEAEATELDETFLDDGQEAGTDGTGGTRNTEKKCSYGGTSSERLF